jgi:threonine/homoserine/homoserine lactone efflux protein
MNAGCPPPAFLLACVLIVLAPGPDILYVLATGISRGRMAAIVAAGGFASGLSVHTGCLAFGLSALLVASGAAFACVKFAGAAYLFWLGIKALRSQGVISLAAGEKPAARPRIFAQAFLMNVLNPKVALFFLAFLPHFASPERGHLLRQFLVLGAWLAVVAFAIFSVVGVFSSGIGGWLRARPRATRWIDRLVGAVFLGIGVRMVV